MPGDVSLLIFGQSHSNAPWVEQLGAKIQELNQAKVPVTICLERSSALSQDDLLKDACIRTAAFEYFSGLAAQNPPGTPDRDDFQTHAQAVFAPGAALPTASLDKTFQQFNGFYQKDWALNLKKTASSARLERAELELLKLAQAEGIPFKGIDSPAISDARSNLTRAEHPRMRHMADSVAGEAQSMSAQQGGVIVVVNTGAIHAMALESMVEDRVNQLTVNGQMQGNLHAKACGVIDSPGLAGKCRDEAEITQHFLTSPKRMKTASQQAVILQTTVLSELDRHAVASALPTAGEMKKLAARMITGDENAPMSKVGKKIAKNPELQSLDSYFQKLSVMPDHQNLPMSRAFEKIKFFNDLKARGAALKEGYLKADFDALVDKIPNAKEDFVRLKTTIQTKSVEPGRFMHPGAAGSYDIALAPLIQTVQLRHAPPAPLLQQQQPPPPAPLDDQAPEPPKALSMREQRAQEKAALELKHHQSHSINSTGARSGVDEAHEKDALLPKKKRTCGNSCNIL